MTGDWLEDELNADDYEEAREQLETAVKKAKMNNRFTPINCDRCEIPTNDWLTIQVRWTKSGLARLCWQCQILEEDLNREKGD